MLQLISLQSLIAPVVFFTEILLINSYLFSGYDNQIQQTLSQPHSK